MKLRIKIIFVVLAIIIAVFAWAIWKSKNPSGITVVAGEFELDCPVGWTDAGGSSSLRGCGPRYETQTADYVSVAVETKALDKPFAEFIQEQIKFSNDHGEPVIQSEPYEWKGVSGWRLMSTHPYYDTDERLIPTRDGKAVFIALLRYQGSDDEEKAEYHALAQKVFETLRYSK